MRLNYCAICFSVVHFSTVLGFPIFFDIEPERGEAFDSEVMKSIDIAQVGSTLSEMARIADITFRGISDSPGGQNMSDIQQAVIRNTFVSISSDQPGVGLLDSKFLYQGDILLTPVQAGALLEEAKNELFGNPVSADSAPDLESNNIWNRRVKRKFNNEDHEEKLWDSKRPIKYTIDSKLDSKGNEAIMAAIREWESRTCLVFERDDDPSEEEEEYGILEFFKGRGCYSMIGRLGRRQYVSIGWGCEAVGVVAHEMGHALGLWHEQSRPDRDSFITINYDTIYNGLHYNFMKQTPAMIKTFGVPFDLGSVMMYGSQAFSKDWEKNTITTNLPGYQKTIGQRQQISFYDVKIINEAYCQNTCGYGSWNPCKHGGYLNPKNCQKCECPDGLGGFYCGKNEEPKNANCGGTIFLHGSEEEVTSPGYPSGFKADQKCSWIIRAPEGKRVFLEFVDQFHFTCTKTCEDYVEVKNGTDLATTGMRFCCDQKPVNRVYAATNEMILIFKSGEREDIGFKARFNYWPEEQSWYIERYARTRIEF